MEYTLNELLEIIKIRKSRCEKYIKDSETGDLVKARVLAPELAIYELALEGIKALQEKRKLKELSFDTNPVQTAVLPTD